MLLPAASGATGRPCALSRPVRTCLPPIPVASAPRAGRAAARRAVAARAEGTLGACVPVEVTAFGFSLDFVDRVRFELFQNAGNRIKRDAQDSLAQESARRERTGHAQAAARVGVTPRQGRVLPRPPRRTAPARREEQRQHYVLNVLTKAIPSRSIPRSSGNSTPLIAKLPPPHLPPPLPLSLSEPVAAWLVPRAAASGCGLVHL